MNKYINTDLLPSGVNNYPWLYEIKDFNDIGSADVGKWMLFYLKSELDQKWSDIKKLYNNDGLPGVIHLKCSTNMPNPRSSNNNDGVIIIYCKNSYDEGTIISIGTNIIEVTKYNKTLYYKTDEQTRNGTRATGSTKNYLYKI